jgi:hypothetical protein
MIAYARVVMVSKMYKVEVWANGLFGPEETEYKDTFIHTFESEPTARAYILAMKEVGEYVYHNVKIKLNGKEI